MTSRALIGLLALTALTLAATPVVAQDITAEVRTWGGQSLRLSQPSLEVFYSIVAKQDDKSAGGGGATQVNRITTLSGLSVGYLRSAPDPSLMTLSRLFGDSAPDTIQGHRQAEQITVYRGGVATQIPLANVAAMTFRRQPVADSSLPPYVAATHARYSADIALVDGSRVEADYVNLGSAIFRGTTPQGRLDIPWQDIETLRFSR